MRTLTPPPCPRPAPFARALSSDAGEWTAVGFGLNVRMVGMGMHFQPLNTAAVTKAYRASENRLIFLDWGGTLIPLGAEQPARAASGNRLARPSGPARGGARRRAALAAAARARRC